jgi:hypothetical protein
MSEFLKNVSQPDQFKAFSSNKFLSGSQEFLDSNSIVAKFSFLLLVLLIFIILLRLGTTLLATLLAPNPDPYIIKGMVDAKKMRVIPQNPNNNKSIPILRSINERDGIEFTWSVWLYIDDLTYQQGQYRHIFHKGNDYGDTKNKGLNFPNNAPGLYIDPTLNNLVVVMNTFDKINEEIIIEDIPINKWLSVIIKCDGVNLDVYINGTLARRHILSSVPKQNYEDVYVAMNGGFSGYISDLRYFNNSLSTSRIQSIVSKGPNKKMLGGDKVMSEPKYLSTRWFFMGTKDNYES